MQLTDVPEQNADVAARIIDGTAYLMDPTAGELHALSEVGTRIYGLVDGHRTVAQIVAALVDEYDVDQAVVERDALDFLETLAAKGLVRPA